MQPKLVPISSLSGIAVKTVMQVDTSLSRLPLVEHLLTGIEVEAENVEWGRDVNLYSSGWTAHEDGSLRDGGVEWVLERPLAGAELATAVSHLYAQDLDYGPSPRAGTHIHVNMTDRSFGDVQAMLTLMYCIDRLVFAWADEDRMWCSYCNSLNTLPPFTLRSALLDEEDPYLSAQRVWPQSNSDRYYGFNVAALWKYGTLEFRYFPTINAEHRMWQWLDFCHAVYRWCTTVPSLDSDVSMAQQVLRRVLDNPDALLAEVFAGADSVEQGLRAMPGWEASMVEAAEELALLLSVDTSTPATISDAGVPRFSEDAPSVVYHLDYPAHNASPGDGIAAIERLARLQQAYTSRHNNRAQLPGISNADLAGRGYYWVDAPICPTPEADYISPDNDQTAAAAEGVL